jgi:regulator of telomere elongation helicase 1
LLIDNEEQDDEEFKRVIPGSSTNLFVKADNTKNLFREPGMGGGGGGKTMVLPQQRIEYKSQEVLKRQVKFAVDLGPLTTGNNSQLQGGTIDVYFPFKPYQCQVDYMTRVIRALNLGENALLESPTGTGKTLSLLCSSLAWLKKERERNPVDPKLMGQDNKPALLDLPKIIYTSRTHS